MVKRTVKRATVDVTYECLPGCRVKGRHRTCTDKPNIPLGGRLYGCNVCGKVLRSRRGG